MNASQIINDDMTLEEKLKAIADAVEQAQQSTVLATTNGQVFAPVDPADLTICHGCQ